MRNLRFATNFVKVCEKHGGSNRRKNLRNFSSRNVDDCNDGGDGLVSWEELEDVIHLGIFQSLSDLNDAVTKSQEWQPVAMVDVPREGANKEMAKDEIVGSVVIVDSKANGVATSRERDVENCGERGDSETAVEDSSTHEDMHIGDPGFDTDKRQEETVTSSFTLHESSSLADAATSPVRVRKKKKRSNGIKGSHKSIGAASGSGGDDREKKSASTKPWECSICTYINERGMHLICEICGSPRIS